LFKDNPKRRSTRSVQREERRMVRELDWAALMRYGASFFCLEKLGRVKGVSNPEMVAGFRGESLEEFLKTRNVPGARRLAASPQDNAILRGISEKRRLTRQIRWFSEADFTLGDR